MEHKLKEILILGLTVTVTLYVLLFVLNIYMGFFISYTYPLGYVLLVVSYLILVPIIVGAIDVTVKHYVLGYSEKMSLSFWYYGIFYLLIHKTFDTLFMYFPIYVYIPATFILSLLALGGVSTMVNNGD